MSESGVYYFPLGDQIVIAWELYQKNAVTASDAGVQGYSFGVIEIYQLCCMAVEGPRGAMMYPQEQFEKDFIFIGEFK